MKKSSLLIVEDEVFLLDVLRELFAPTVDHVYTAVNGEEAIAILNSGKDIDCILTDINMPKLNGIKFIKKIREMKLLLPVIFLTAYDSEQFMREALNYGAYDFVVKPFVAHKLLEVVNKALVFEMNRRNHFHHIFETDSDNEFTKQYIEMLKNKC